MSENRAGAVTLFVCEKPACEARHPGRLREHGFGSKGMVNNLEASFFLPLVGSVAIEQSFIVEAAGAGEVIPKPQPVLIVSSALTLASPC